MAKTSVVNRELERQRTVDRYKEKRAALKEQAQVAYAKGEIPWDVQHKIQQLPRNASPVRTQSRCRTCGRAHAVYRKFALCRICLRKFGMLGLLPGLEKASW